MSPKRLLFSGGTVIDPVAGKARRQDVLVENGMVVEIGRVGAVGAGGERVDCRGKFLSPGFIDLHCHLREPGEEHKETIETGTRAALAGGWTQVCAMGNTNPPIDSEALVRFVLTRAREAGLARVHPVGCCTKGRQGKELAELAGMKAAGAVAVSDDGSWISDGELMRRVLEYAKTFDLLVMSHCEVPELAAGSANEGLVATQLGIAGTSFVAETAAAARDILLAELTRSRIHICHVSCAATVELLRWAKGRKIPVTADTCPHYITLTEDGVRGFDTNYKVNPPLRTEQDRRAVIAGLADGTIDCLATDHAPHAQEEKEVEFDLAPPGMIGFETAFSLGYEQLVLKKVLSLVEFISRLTVVPARIIGLEPPRIALGQEANLVVIDPDAKWTFTREAILSRSRNTPFLGRTMRGRVVATLLGTQLWTPANH
ncbi:MAG: dihydroorotase [candidate division WOR-3 bacterium]